MHPESSRRCPRCGEEQPVSLFYWQNGRPHGYCKPCISPGPRGWRNQGLSLYERVVAAAPRFMRWVDMPSGCREWTGTRTERGYGHITIPTGKGTGTGVGAHRMAWMLVHGPIPEGMFVCHRCDNPPCILIEHLFLSTPQGNMDDKVNKNRQTRVGPRVPATGARNGKYTKPEKTARGERVATARLTGAQVLTIKQRLSDGARQVDIAVEYGVTRGIINRIAVGKTWTHV